MTAGSETGPPGEAAVSRETGLRAAIPLLLIPVRIETRFAAASRSPDAAAAGPALLLRVYPDTISISSFEPELTQDEINAGQAYWNQLWLAGSPPPDADVAQAPWRVLAAAYGPPRAAWIALQLTPVNLAAQPAAPTPAGQQPTPAPQFPSPPTRASSYEQAPTARALPGAWTVTLYRGTEMRQVTGSQIVPDLAVGFTPHDGTLPAGLPVDAGMRWLVDFDEAVKVGMALRIQLTEAEFATGFDRIIVYGVAGPKADPGSGQVLAALLDAHHYGEGLALVPQGAPTKNTPGASTGYSKQDPDYAVSFAVERSAPLTSAADGDGAQAAQLLGVPVATFSHVQYADGHGIRNGHDMITALWPATLGYFMEQMMAPQFSRDAADAARAYALANAIPRGPLPALRVASTPYGILPVTSLAIASAQAPPVPTTANPRGALAAFLARLLPVWQASVPFAPHIGATADPDTDLAQVLGMDASAIDFHGRQVIGDDLMWNLLSFLGVALQDWWLEHLLTGRAPLDSLGLTTWTPRIIYTSMGQQSYPVPYPTVQDGPLSETEPLTADATVGGQQVNYIQWLATASADDIWAENYPGPPPSSILYRILRQSVLGEYVTLAGRAQVDAGLLAPSALREQELVNIDTAAPSITPAEIISRPVAPGSSITWAQYLHDLQPPPDSPFARFAELRASLGRLAGVPTAELDRLLTETLDACSHRLDVWVTALATDLLGAQRAGQAAQAQPPVHLGAYSWVENVRPAARTPVVTGTDAAAVRRLDASRPAAAAPQPVRQPDSGSGGFIQAPSMTQAAAGAVLRSGYLSHRGTADEQLLAIDLSSQRTSAALWLLDGVRQGQSLGALTGYQFEQSLHELQLDVYIQPFRDAYPLIGTDLTAQTAAGPVTSPSQVVDGVKLSAAWRSGALPAGSYWGTGLPLPAPPGNATQNAVLSVLSQIDDMLSALSDLSIAESVFQVMRGNLGRAGGMLGAISQGSQPPEPGLPPTPRAGVDVTHRLMLLFTGPPPAAPAWAGISTHPRALAEPWLSAWVASRLPDPATVRCLVTWTAAGQNAVPGRLAARPGHRPARRARPGRRQQPAAARRTGEPHHLRGEPAAGRGDHHPQLRGGQPAGRVSAIPQPARGGPGPARCDRRGPGAHRRRLQPARRQRNHRRRNDRPGRTERAGQCPARGPASRHRDTADGDHERRHRTAGRQRRPHHGERLRRRRHHPAARPANRTRPDRAGHPGPRPADPAGHRRPADHPARRHHGGGRRGDPGHHRQGRGDPAAPDPAGPDRAAVRLRRVRHHAGRRSGGSRPLAAPAQPHPPRGRTGRPRVGADPAPRRGQAQAHRRTATRDAGRPLARPARRPGESARLRPGRDRGLRHR